MWVGVRVSGCVGGCAGVSVGVGVGGWMGGYGWGGFVPPPPQYLLKVKKDQPG